MVLTDRSGGFADLWMDYGPYGQVPMHASLEKWRAPPAESAWEKDLLETAFLKKTVGSSRYYCPLDQVGKSLTFFLEIGWKIKDCRGKQVMRAGESALQLASDQERLSVRGKIAYEEHTVELADVIGAFNRRERFLDLGEGKVAWIDFEQVEQEWGDLLEEEIVGKEIAVKKNRFAVLEPLFPKEGSGAAYPAAHPICSQRDLCGNAFSLSARGRRLADVPLQIGLSWTACR